jgi:hypothetical protein
LCEGGRARLENVIEITLKLSLKLPGSDVKHTSLRQTHLAVVFHVHPTYP